MRKSLLAVAVVVAAFLSSVLVSPAGAHHRPGHSRPHSAGVDVRGIHDTTCLKVVQYTSCPAVKVTVARYGLTGWSARSAPAAGSVEYNTSYDMPSSYWAATVAHEMGGHHDVWNEVVAKVGPSQAWTDYYDLDYFGERFFEERLGRDVSRLMGKELYLDCAGPVAHGYSGSYLSRYVVVSQQVAACSGSSIVMSQALTSSRP